MKTYTKFKAQLYNHKKEEELKQLMGTDEVTYDRPFIDIYVCLDDIVGFHPQYDEDSNILDRVDIHTVGGHSFTLLCEIETFKQRIGNIL